MNDIAEILAYGVTLGSSVYAPATIAGDITQQRFNNKWAETAAKTMQSFNVAQMLFMATALTLDALDLSSRIVITMGGFAYLSVLSIPLLIRAIEKVCPDLAENIARFEKQYGKFLKIANIAAATFALIAAGSISFSIVIAINAAVLASSGYALAKELTRDGYPVFPPCYLQNSSTSPLSSPRARKEIA